MNARDFYTIADGQLGDALPFLMGFAVPALLFVFKGAWKKSESSQAYIQQILKDIGLLEAARDRAKEKDDEQGKQISELQKSVQDSRERIIVLEHEVKK